MLITIQNNNFTVISKKTEKGVMRKLVDKFSTFTSFKVGGRFVTKKDKVFISGNRSRREYIFKISYLYEFIDFVTENGIDGKNISFAEDKFKPKRKLSIKLAKKFILRNEQKFIKKQVFKDSDKHAKLIMMQTGTGKTITALSVAADIKNRVAIIIPKWIDKWVEDLKETLNATDEEIYVAQGFDSLNKLLNGVPKEVKFIIFSGRTLFNYFRSYEKMMSKKLFKYDDTPINIGKKLDIGLVIADEAHKEFYNLYVSSLYFDVPLFLGLSATFTNSDKKIRKFQEMLFPKDCRFELEYNKYVHVRALSYVIKGIELKNHTNPLGFYSHNEFEQNIIRDKDMLERYTNLLLEVIHNIYFDTKQDGDRLLVYVDSIKMANIMVKLVRKEFSKLRVERYVEDDPYENILEPDICITNLGKAQEAIDIPQLTRVLQTISVDSDIANEQTKGRLRPIPGTITEFTYMYCNGIERHRQYHRNKLIQFKGKMKKLILDNIIG